LTRPPEDSARILVVDDEPRIREILVEFLGMEGYEVDDADSGEAALVSLSRQTYDIVLTDLKMPKMGGIELLESISAHTPDVLVILMTGFGTVESAIHSMKAGAYDYLLKPFKMDEVIHTVQRALKRRRLQQENLQLRQALSLYKVTEALSTSLSVEAVLKTLASAAVDEIGADQVEIILENGLGGFEVRKRVFHESFYRALDAVHIELDKLAHYFQTESALRVFEDDCLPFFQTPPGGELRCAALMAIPLRVREKCVGFLVCVSYQRQKRFTEGQRKLAHIVGDRATASIDNAQLYESLQATFHQTINGLASAIDTMDHYTAGHSQRVAAYAELLAIKLDLSTPEVEVVRQAALMHDIGKLGCVLNLNKPGSLTEPEYEAFKKHPTYGREILEPIEFLSPLIPGVHLHHERWDGMGYPLGLKSADIPLVARIISVADTYDAMTSDRAYRKALPHQTAVREIGRCAGTQFDPEVAASFATTIENWYQEQQAGK